MKVHKRKAQDAILRGVLTDKVGKPELQMFSQVAGIGARHLRFLTGSEALGGSCCTDKFADVLADMTTTHKSALVCLQTPFAGKKRANKNLF